MTRDTAKYAPLQGLARTKKPGLKTLAKLCLGVDIQSGEHSSVSIYYHQYIFTILMLVVPTG